MKRELVVWAMGYLQLNDANEAKWQLKEVFDLFMAQVEGVVVAKYDRTSKGSQEHGMVLIFLVDEPLVRCQSPTAPKG
jgi:hypothetical protein